ncbi:hypothetical protein K503DRAFT_775436 [Rhizopogon vinicolor AM-OR11-026]|uniref:Uncharacterized protein n=1 Tax=Rhizopogon vinicolor AM-OR11-026 TaxID=1314800 RepID=A0A1B7MM11_9AGAM|nr:hypothetical protein K503DRAFT_775436 [Rhizopogon vinicolor AM-OR11-026]
MKTSPAGKLAMGIEHLWSPCTTLSYSCRKFAAANSRRHSPYGAERLIRGGIFHPTTTSLCVAHTCLVLAHMDACNYYHAGARILLPRMPANLAHTEGGDFTNSLYRSFLTSHYHFLLPHLDASLDLQLLLFWGSEVHFAASFHS